MRLAARRTHRHYLAIYLSLLAGLLVGGLAACGGSASRAVPPTPPPPTPTPTPTPTLSVPTRDVTFTTSDHLTLHGKLFGHGTTYIVLSNHDDNFAKDWDSVAQQLAARGYSALTYDYRGKGQSQGEWVPSTPLATDLRAAVAFARQQGARKVVLMGASLGGAVTANVAADGGFAAIVMLSAPRRWAGLDVTDALLRSITAPKLLLASAQDTYTQGTQAMYDAAQPPKEIQLYPGAWHGIAILNPATENDALTRVLTFLAKYAPAN